MGVLNSYRVELDELRAGQKTYQEAQSKASIVAPEQTQQGKRSQKAATPAVLRAASPVGDSASKSFMSHISELIVEHKRVNRNTCTEKECYTTPKIEK